jgi:putative ABC transport system substrate-binding protein
MRRRELITLLGGVLAWPVAAHSQQSPLPVVGYLTAGTPEVSVSAVKAFLEGLGEINVTIEYRWAQNERARLPDLVADLVGRHVAVIATPGSVPAAVDAKAATRHDAKSNRISSSFGFRFATTPR